MIRFAPVCAIIAALAAAPLAQAATMKVQIDNYAFAPTNLSVHPGDTVVWTNRDSVPHTVTSIGAGGLDSGTLDPGGSFRFTFRKAGAYSYHCAIHPEMRAMVRVR
ncbi:MAG TPA: cupredoxin family copper-binding protein [Acetobacteraceae bacterium]|nr:cupredoxin family copper-binding protein [Acetobacteraceae bacterium]